MKEGENMEIEWLINDKREQVKEKHKKMIFFIIIVIFLISIGVLLITPPNSLIISIKYIFVLISFIIFAVIFSIYIMPNTFPMKVGFSEKGVHIKYSWKEVVYSWNEIKEVIKDEIWTFSHILLKNGKKVDLGILDKMIIYEVHKRWLEQKRMK